jgi:putative membrane protein
MNASQYDLSVRALFVATLTALVLTGCGAQQNQGRSASAETVAATKPGQQSMRQTSSKPAAARSPSRYVVAASHMAATNNQENATKENTEAVLSQIHQANLTEISLGKLGEEKATTIEIRAYADQVVLDHTNIDLTVAAMAQKKGIRLRDQTASTRERRDREQSNRQFDQKLKSASGSEFDKLFLEQAGSDHQRLIEQLQQDREDANDDELEALIDKIAPIFEQDRELEKILIKKEQA